MKKIAPYVFKINDTQVLETKDYLWNLSRKKDNKCYKKKVGWEHTITKQKTEAFGQIEVKFKIVNKTFTKVYLIKWSVNGIYCNQTKVNIWCHMQYRIIPS